MFLRMCVCIGGFAVSDLPPTPPVSVWREGRGRDKGRGRELDVLHASSKLSSILSLLRLDWPCGCPLFCCIQRGGDFAGSGDGVLHQRERAAEGDALLREPSGVVRGYCDVRQHVHLHVPHVPAHLHQVSATAFLVFVSGSPLPPPPLPRSPRCKCCNLRLSMRLKLTDITS